MGKKEIITSDLGGYSLDFLNLSLTFAWTYTLTRILLKLKLNYIKRESCVIYKIWRLFFYSISRFPTVCHDKGCFVIHSIRWIFTMRRSSSRVWQFDARFNEYHHLSTNIWNQCFLGKDVHHYTIKHIWTADTQSVRKFIALLYSLTKTMFYQNNSE